MAVRWLVVAGLAQCAKQAMINGQPYSGLSEGIYDRRLIMPFDAAAVCENSRKATP
ncbi:hypothetical protein ABAC460_21375 [Asticcacaulis sp. AC460]|nr:hypothetical protein ABAC460_21375 [Asticcacaulis sp. AC460]